MVEMLSVGGFDPVLISPLLTAQISVVERWLFGDKERRVEERRE
jgi:hypothetical protein